MLVRFNLFCSGIRSSTSGTSGEALSSSWYISILTYNTALECQHLCSLEKLPLLGPTTPKGCPCPRPVLIQRDETTYQVLLIEKIQLWRPPRCACDLHVP